MTHLTRMLAVAAVSSVALSGVAIAQAPSGATNARDAMMEKDSMKKEEMMKKDEMKKDAMKSEKMMKEDEMKKDAMMKKDEMKK